MAARMIPIITQRLFYTKEKRDKYCLRTIKYYIDGGQSFLLIPDLLLIDI